MKSALTSKPEPRLHLPASDLRKQFSAAQIEAMVAAAPGEDGPPDADILARGVRVNGGGIEAVREALARRHGERGPQKAPTKQAVSLRLDPRVIKHYKAGGPGWQSRINRDLLGMVVLQEVPAPKPRTKPPAA